MKHIKQYEQNYKYLNQEDTEKVKTFVEKFYVDSDFMSEIKNLKWVDFVKDDFNSKDIFEKITSSKYYTNGNLYYDVDNYCRDKGITGVVSLRNSLFDIHKEIYNKYQPDFENSLDDRLIKILEKNPKKYKKRFNIYDDKFSDKVKDACQWMLDYRTYNL